MAYYGTIQKLKQFSLILSVPVSINFLMFQLVHSKDQLNISTILIKIKITFIDSYFF